MTVPQRREVSAPVAEKLAAAGRQLLDAMNAAALGSRGRFGNEMDVLDATLAEFSAAPSPQSAAPPSELDKSIYDKSWGVGGWVLHYDCPTNDTGQPYVVHSVKFHDARAAPSPTEKGDEE